MSYTFVTGDAKAIYEDLIRQMETALDTTLYPGDERRIFLEQLALVVMGIKGKINDAANQNLLRYARDELLDLMGEYAQTPRLLAMMAGTILRFTLASARGTNTIIEAGTRATPDGKVFFTTKQALTITAGSLYGDAPAEAIEAGAAMNDYVPGQINILVDPIPYVASVSNTTASSGGADREPDDDGVNVWSGYRGRIRDSAGSVSTAGHEDGYKYHAKSANSGISSVAVTSPAACQVKITVLMQGGELPGQTVLDQVLAACSGKKVRPLTDQVTAAAPGTVAADIDLSYMIDTADAQREAAIRSAVEDSGGAVDQYRAWQVAELGRAINPDQLKKLVLNAGATRAIITSPVYTAIENDEVAVIGTVTVAYSGLE